MIRKCYECESGVITKGKGRVLCANCRRIKRRESVTRYNRKIGHKALVEKACIWCTKLFFEHEGGNELCEKCRGLRNYRNWRARFYGCENKFTELEWNNILKFSNGECAKCGKKVGINNLTQEHKTNMVLAKGKAYYIEDIEALCKECNSRKNNRGEAK